MAKVPFPIANGFYLSESLPISAQECINLYPNLPQVPALSQETLLGTPGLKQLATTGSGVNRGFHVKGGIAYAVNGTELFRIDRTIATPEDTFSTTSLGTVTGSGRVSMADNGTQLMIVANNGDGFIFNEDSGTPFQAITDANFITTNGTPQIVVYIDSFFLVSTDSKKFKISNLNDGLTWNALDFGSADADPDDIVAPFVFGDQLYISGSETIQRFQNIGGAAFPFQTVRGGTLNKGIFAKFSIIEASNAFMWIGGDTNESAAIWRSSGGLPEKISTTAIENAIQKFTAEEIAAAFAYSYAEKGAYFVGFTIGTKTFVYDTATGRWHQRVSTIAGSNVDRYRVNSLVTAYGRVLVGDFKDGRIGEISNNNDEYGELIFRRFSTQPLANNSNPIFIADIELTIESGVGNSDDPDPKIRLDFSDDGRTFGIPRSRSMGKVGEYFRRCIWRRLGRAPRFRIFRWTMTDKVVSNVIKLEMDIV